MIKNNQKSIIIFIVLFTIFILFVASNTKNTDHLVESIQLTIYGQNESPDEYYTTNQETIDVIVDSINSMSLSKDNQIAKTNEFDLPKTTSYVLEINGKESSKYTFVNNYVLYEDFVYQLNNQSVIQSIEEQIKVNTSL